MLLSSLLFLFRWLFIVSIQSITIMKSIQISGYNHERIMNKKTSVDKSADAVISRMFEDICEMIAEFDSFLVDGNIIIDDETTEILNRNRIKFVR